MTILIPPTASTEQKLEAIRSTVTHRLLAQYDRDGLYLWDRQSNSRHLIRWDELARLAEQTECARLLNAS